MLVFKITGNTFHFQIYVSLKFSSECNEKNNDFPTMGDVVTIDSRLQKSI